MLWMPQLCESRSVNARSLRLSWGSSLIKGSNYSGLLFSFSAIYLAIGIVAFVGWRASGNDLWVRRFFEVPGSFLLVFLAAAELWFCSQVLSRYEPGEAMRGVWLFLTASAAFDVAGAVCSQVLSLDSAVNPLRLAQWWNAELKEAIRAYGQLLGGTCRFTLLAVGLGLAVQVYRKAGLHGRLRALDWVVLAGMAAFVAAEARDIVRLMASGSRPVSTAEMSGWPVDALLWVLLAEALLLYRSASRMDSGWLGRCWKALAAGVFLLSLGTVSLWASRWSYVPWPWSALFWYLWIPAATAVAMGPAYQLEAIQAAMAAGNADQTSA